MVDWLKRLSLRARQWLVAAVVLAIVASLAVAKAGPFSWEPPVTTQRTGFFEALLGERYTLGLVRVALIALGVFVVLSVPALVVAGRWLKGFSKEGLTADDAEAADDTIADLRSQLVEVTRERDKLAEVAIEKQAQLAEVGKIVGEALRMVQSLPPPPTPPTPGEGGS